MATVDLYFKDLKSELNDCSIDEFESILFNYGIEMESYNAETDEIKIDITAERPDLLSKEGLLRALKTYLGIDKIKSYCSKKSEYLLNIDNSVREIRPHSVCAVVKNLNLNSEKLKQIIQVQEKLHLTLGRKRTLVAIGIYPLDKINWPISFISKKPEEIKFIPLGETKEMNGNQILNETQAGQEFSCLLRNKNRFPIFIDNSKNILSMPPIINSETIGKITEDTKDVFIECSGMDLIRLNQILNIICCVFSDFDGDIYSVTINYSKEYNIKSKTTPELNDEKRLISLNHINSTIGININIDDACGLLEKMCYKCKKYGKDNIEVSIPPFRTDVLHEVDIIDDIARAYGYNNIKFKLPKVFTIGAVLDSTIKQDNIIDIMVQLGFLEVSPLSLSNKKECFSNLKLEYNKGQTIELGYSKDKQLDIMCNTHISKLFKILGNNQHRSFPQKIFVCDYVVKASKKEENRAEQQLHLCALISNSKVSFTDLSSVLLTLCNILGINIELQKSQKPFYISGRSAEVLINGTAVGHIGEIDPEVISNFEYGMPVVAFEIDVTNI